MIGMLFSRFNDYYKFYKIQYKINLASLSIENQFVAKDIEIIK